MDCSSTFHPLWIGDFFNFFGGRRIKPNKNNRSQTLERIVFFFFLTKSIGVNCLKSNAFAGAVVSRTIGACRIYGPYLIMNFDSTRFPIGIIAALLSTFTDNNYSVHFNLKYDCTFLKIVLRNFV